MKSIGKTNADGSSRDSRRLALAERSLRRQTKASRDLDDHSDYLADKASRWLLRLIAAAHARFTPLATQPEDGLALAAQECRGSILAGLSDRRFRADACFLKEHENDPAIRK